MKSVSLTNRFSDGYDIICPAIGFKQLRADVRQKDAL